VHEIFTLTLAAAQTRIATVRPAACARMRSALDGAVSGLSPCTPRGCVTLPEVLAGVAARHALDVQHRSVFELRWCACFRHAWQHRVEGILHPLREGLLPEDVPPRDRHLSRPEPSLQRSPLISPTSP